MRLFNSVWFRMPSVSRAALRVGIVPNAQDAITSRLRAGRDDAQLLPEDRVQQGGLADVGATDQCDVAASMGRVGHAGAVLTLGLCRRPGGRQGPAVALLAQSSFHVARRWLRVAPRGSRAEHGARYAPEGVRASTDEPGAACRFMASDIGLFTRSHERKSTRPDHECGMQRPRRRGTQTPPRLAGAGPGGADRRGPLETNKVHTRLQPDPYDLHAALSQRMPSPLVITASSTDIGIQPRLSASSDAVPSRAGAGRTSRMHPSEATLRADATAVAWLEPGRPGARWTITRTPRPRSSARREPKARSRRCGRGSPILRRRESRRGSRPRRDHPATSRQAWPRSWRGRTSPEPEAAVATRHGLPSSAPPPPQRGVDEVAAVKNDLGGASCALERRRHLVGPGKPRETSRRTVKAARSADAVGNQYRRDTRTGQVSSKDGSVRQSPRGSRRLACCLAAGEELAVLPCASTVQIASWLGPSRSTTTYPEYPAHGVEGTLERSSGGGPPPKVRADFGQLLRRRAAAFHHRIHRLQPPIEKHRGDHGFVSVREVEALASPAAAPRPTRRCTARFSSSARR